MRLWRRRLLLSPHTSLACACPLAFHCWGLWQVRHLPLFPGTSNQVLKTVEPVEPYPLSDLHSRVHCCKLKLKRPSRWTSPWISCCDYPIESNAGWHAELNERVKIGV